MTATRQIPCPTCHGRSRATRTYDYARGIYVTEYCTGCDGRDVISVPTFQGTADPADLRAAINDITTATAPARRDRGKDHAP